MIDVLMFIYLHALLVDVANELRHQELAESIVLYLVWQRQ